jgi:hypothetical protein
LGNLRSGKDKDEAQHGGHALTPGAVTQSAALRLLSKEG